MATVSQLEADLEAARVAEQQAAKDRTEQQKEQDRNQRDMAANASAEIRSLRERIEKALAAKRPATSRPTVGARGLSRKFLHQGCDYFEVDTLAHLDDAFAEFFGLNGAAQQMVIRMQSLAIADDALFGAVDALEVKSWAAVVQRAAILAGEAES